MSTRPPAKTSKSARSAATSTHTLGERIRLLRSIHGLSLETLAARTALTKSYLSKVERSVAEPSLATVLKLCEAFGITTGQLLDEAPSDGRVHVVRCSERTRLSKLSHYEGYVYEALASQRVDKLMLPFVMRPPHRPRKVAELVQHSGQELIFVLAGELEVRLADQVLRLGVGDAVYFDSALPHRSISVGEVPAEALVVVAGGAAPRS